MVYFETWAGCWVINLDFNSLIKWFEEYVEPYLILLNIYETDFEIKEPDEAIKGKDVTKLFKNSSRTLIWKVRLTGLPHDVSSLYSHVSENLITIKQLKPLIQSQLESFGPKGKRVFVGGSYRNIALLRYIAYQIVQNFDDFKAVLVADLPKLSSEAYDHLTHDISMEYLKGCSHAIFEVSISNGPLMEIERANDIAGLKVVLVFQRTRTEEEPTITKMVTTTHFRKIGYRNFAELTTELGRFLGIV